MRPVWSSQLIAATLVACHATTAPVVTIAQTNTATNPVVTQQPSLETFGVVDDLATYEERRVGYSKDDVWLGYEISTCDPCPEELQFESAAKKQLSFSYYYDPGNHDDEKEKKTNAEVDARLAALDVTKATLAKKLRGAFPYPELHFTTKTETNDKTGEVTLSFGANGVFPMKVTLGPMPMWSRVPKEERETYVLEPTLVYANVTRDGSEIGIVVIGHGPMWFEAGGVARMRTTDFVAAVRRQRP